MRAVLAGLVVSVVMATTAGAADYPGPPAVSYTDTGQSAVAWTLSEGLSEGPDAGVALGRPGAMRTIRVRLGSITAPSFGFGNVPFLAVAAQPGGGARLLWLAETIDYEVPQPSYGSALRTMLITADGTASPVQDVATGAYGLSTATNARGDMLAAFSVDSHSMLAEAPSGRTFATAPAPLDALQVVPALADNGAAAVAGGTSVAIRPPDGTFGTPLTVPDLGDARALDIASDGTTVVADGGGAALRPPGGVFGAAVHEAGNLNVSPVGAAAFTGGQGLFTLSSGPSRVFDLPPGGGAPILRDTSSVDFFGAQLAAREDGGALVARYDELFARDAVGAFRPAMPLKGRFNALGLALSAAGPLVAGTTATRKENVAVVNEQQVARYPRDEAPAPPVIPVLVPRRVTVHRRTARVPVRCVIATCRGTIRTGAGARSSFELAFQGGRLVRIRVPAHARRVRLTIKVERPAESTGKVAVVRLRRHLLRNAPPRAGCAAPWLERLAAGGGATLWRLDEQRALACAPQIPPRVLTAGSLGISSPAAINAHWAVLPDASPGHSGLNGSLEFVRHDLVTGATTRLLAQRYGAAPGHDVPKIGVTDGGAVVLVDVLDGHARIRVLTETDDRILDAGPGIDPASLTVAGTTVTWTRDGTPQRAEIA